MTDEERKEHNRASWKKYREKNREARRALSLAGYYKNKEAWLVRVRQKYLDLEHYKWEDVEGYDGWTTNTEVHHRREGIGYSVAQLKEQGQYYNCRADELICVTKAEHKRIHEEIDKFFQRGNYARKSAELVR